MARKTWGDYFKDGKYARAEARYSKAELQDRLAAIAAACEWLGRWPKETALFLEEVYYTQGEAERVAVVEGLIRAMGPADGSFRYAQDIIRRLYAYAQREGGPMPGIEDGRVYGAHHDSPGNHADNHSDDYMDYFGDGGGHSDHTDTGEGHSDVPERRLTLG